MCSTKYGSKLRNKKVWNPIQGRSKKNFQDYSERKTNILKLSWRESTQIRAGELTATESRQGKKERERKKWGAKGKKRKEVGGVSGRSSQKTFTHTLQTLCLLHSKNFELSVYMPRATGYIFHTFYFTYHLHEVFFVQAERIFHIY